MTGRPILGERTKSKNWRLPLVRPGVAAPSLALRLGTEALRDQGGVRYLELRARSLVGRCSSPGMPFDWTVNPYRGCAMGCRYCYAAYTHGFLGRDGVSEFHSRIYVKTGGDAETSRRVTSPKRARGPDSTGWLDYCPISRRRSTSRLPVTPRWATAMSCCPPLGDFSDRLRPRSES